MICCWISWCFFWQYPSVQVCILGIKSLYYTFIWFVPCFYSVYACTCTAVGWWKCRFSNTTGATIGANLLDHLFFVVVLFCCGFILLLFVFVCVGFVVGQSLFICVVFFFCFSCWPLHCLSFDIRLQITP